MISSMPCCIETEKLSGMNFERKTYKHNLIKIIQLNLNFSALYFVLLAFASGQKIHFTELSSNQTEIILGYFNRPSSIWQD